MYNCRVLGEHQKEACKSGCIDHCVKTACVRVILCYDEVGTLPRQSSGLISQILPVNPGGQRQTNGPVASVHLPPLRQGLVLH